jgi:murein DD-endopeptidase MepM/ murein hydrolase activator NlpD
MDTYSLIVVSDETAPVRRFEVRKDLVKRAIWGSGAVAALLLVLLVDYVRVRVDNSELDGLRAETIERRAQVAEFQETLEQVDGKLARLQEFERKVRTIANLPGATASGGEEVTAVGQHPDEGAEDASRHGEGGLEDATGEDLSMPSREMRVPKAPEGASEEKRVSLLRDAAEYLGVVAGSQEATLSELVEALEGKRHRLASSPSVWPTKGWLTSRYGYRISPFTGKRQFHAGLDIAGAEGTDIVAPARGKVVFAGKRGPLGNSLIIDHGYGMRTQYGHAADLFVKRGQEIERGQRIATLGNTGRSTGPHLHYVVEVKGKTRDPLDYILD